MKRDPACLRENGCAVDGLLFGTTIERLDMREPVLVQQALHTPPATRGERPLGDQDRGVNHDLGMRDARDAT
jgi:hypothetical protein